jgi:glycosyltransferase involved in cell wall biosynthesis
MEKSKNKKCVLYLGTFTPRECGIATFTRDLITAMDNKYYPSLKSEVIALNDNNNIYNYGDKVCLQIEEGSIRDYKKAAIEINKRKDVKIISIQHEFGIFGGEQGSYLISFLNSIKKPVVVTLHSVVPNPDDCKKEIIQEIYKKSSAIIVMAKEAVNILEKDYGIEDFNKKIFFVPHGVPEVSSYYKNIKEKINLKNRTILLTFGLINEGKGITYAIKALPNIVKKYPEIIYLVLGETHPKVRKKEGEAYRNRLIKLVNDLGLKDNVKFNNKYLTLKEIITYLCAADIYISPSLDKNQIVSGTLSYALGCGKTIISTSTIYAKEVLSEKRGVLVDFRNPESVEKALINLLSDNELRAKMGKSSYEFGRKMVWPNVAAEYLRIFNKISKIREDVIKKFPVIKLNHLIALTDDTGIMQHAKHSIPDRKNGYTLDDNARALIVATKHYNIFRSEKSLKLINVYLSFLHYVQKKDGKFHNFLDYNKKFLDEEGSEDSFGRSLWACGQVIQSSIHHNTKATAKFIFDNALESIGSVRSPRAKAFSIIGLHHYHRVYNNQDIVDKVKKLANSLIDSYKKNSSQEWKWFEPYLTYSNGKLSEALFLAYDMTKNEEYLTVAKESLDFLLKVLIVDGDLMLIGNEKWYRKDKERSFYDQQPVDASSMVQVCLSAYEVTKNKDHYLNAILAFNWFLGKNSVNIKVYDDSTGGCFDGLSKTHINLNQGAESTISYLLARLNLEEIKLDI